MQHRNLELDRLRAFAAMFVIYMHYANYFFPPMIGGAISSKHFWHFFTTSWAGVDLFFVISGFIISSVLIEKMDSKTARLQIMKTFFIKRFMRIFPVAFCVFVLILFVSFIVNQPIVFGTPQMILAAGKPLLAGWFNFYYPTHDKDLVFLGPYWSLSVEEQFYCFFPLFLILITSGLHRILILSTLLLLITFYIRPHISTNFYFTQTRCDGILYGCLLYYLMRCNKVRFILSYGKNYYSGKILTLILLCVIGVCPFFIGSRVYSIPIICLSASLLVAIASLQKDIISFGVFNRILNYLGSRSYSLYLLHFPVFAMMLEIGLFLNMHYHPTWNARFILAFNLIAFFFILTITELSYRLIERPCIERSTLLSNALRRS